MQHTTKETTQKNVQQIKNPQGSKTNKITKISNVGKAKVFKNSQTNKITKYLNNCTGTYPTREEEIVPGQCKVNVGKFTNQGKNVRDTLRDNDLGQEGILIQRIDQYQRSQPSTSTLRTKESLEATFK